MINIKSTDEVMDGSRTVIELVDEPWTGIKFAYDKMDISDAPNEDGSGTLHFEYDVLPEFYSRVEPVKKEFEQYIGALLIQVLEAQLERNEVVYKGGIGGEFTTTE